MTAYRLKKYKNATVVVTANADVLFMPGGQVYGWFRRFGNQTKKWTAHYAPRNKRPRWAHYGAPLHKTIVSLPPKPRKTRGGMRLYASVGSSAPHAYYVDQGTGIYGGSGPYQAKILPPWTRQSPSLYEHTFKVPSGGGRWAAVGTITVKGQRGQRFMDKGLDRAFAFMLRSSAQIPTNPKVGRALASWPSGLENFKGNTPVSGAFIAQLQEWRAWRDEAFASGRPLGMGSTSYRRALELRDVRRTIASSRRREQSAAVRRAKNAERMRRWRAANPERVEAYNRSRRINPVDLRRSAVDDDGQRLRDTLDANVRRREKRRKRRDKVREAVRDRRLEIAEAEKARRREAAERAEREQIQRNIARNRNREMRAEAVDYYNRIKEMYPDAKFGEGSIPGEPYIKVYRVWFTGPGGEVVRQNWAWGYT